MKTIDPFLRSTAYREFASWYRYPEEALLDELRGRDQETRSAFEALSAQGDLDSIPSIHGLIESVSYASLHDLQTEYVRLFDYRPPCPLYESSYTELEKSNPGKVKLSVENFYNDYGLDTSPSSIEPPDHLIPELEFMHFLSFKEGEAVQNDGADVKKYLVGQQAFSKDHLLPWVPKFCDRLGKNTGLSYYIALAALTKSFILKDADYINFLCRELQ